MKKTAFCFLILAVILMCMSVVAYCDADEPPTKVYVDGTELAFDVQPNEEGYVPVRAIAESLGAELSWDDAARTVTLISNRGTVVLTVGSNVITLNGEEVERWAPVILVDGRTFMNYRNIDQVFYVHIEEKKWNEFHITTDYSLYNVLEDGEIIVGIDPDSPPMSYIDENGNPTGFDVDLAKETAERLGLKVTFKPMEFDLIFDSLFNKDIDMIWDSVAVTENREQNMLFSEPYIQDGFVLVAKKDCEVITRAQLDEIKIGYMPDMVPFEFQGKDNLVLYPDEKSMLTALDSGKIDAFFNRKLHSQNNITMKSDRYKLLNFLFDKEDYAVAFRLGEMYLKDAVQKTIDEMEKDGTYAELVTKWCGEERLAHLAYNEEGKLVYNGNAYKLGDKERTYRWYAVETGERIGPVLQWGDYVKYEHLGTEFEAGVYEVPSSGGATLMLNPPENEFDYLLIREDCPDLTVAVGSIDRVEILEGSYIDLYDHTVCEHGTTDKDVVDKLVDLFVNGEPTKVEKPYTSYKKTLLLYSGDAPGAVYWVGVIVKDGELYIEAQRGKIHIPQELVNSLGTEHKKSR